MLSTGNRENKTLNKYCHTCEYVVLSEALSELKFIKEMVKICNINCSNLINIYEDNSGVINKDEYGNFKKYL